MSEKSIVQEARDIQLAMELITLGVKSRTPDKTL